MRNPRRLAATVVALTVAVTSTLACASGAAHAAGGASSAPSRKALRAACRDDYRRFCGDVPRGDGRIAACFEAHAAELSPGCRSALQAARAARGAAGE